MEAREDMPARPGRELAAFVAAALLCRVLFWLAMPRVIDAADAIHYLDAAKGFSAGDFFGIDPKIPILYPLLGALANVCLGDIEWACRVVSLVASTLLVVPVYLLARDLHGPWSARVAALLVVIWTWLADYGSRVSTEALACTLWFLSVWLLARGVRRGSGWLPAAALSFFALHLTRPEGTFLWLAALPVGAILCTRADTAPRRRVALFAAMSVGLIAAYALYMYGVTGTARISYRAAFVVQDVLQSNVERTSAGTVMLLAKTAANSLFGVLPTMLGPVLLLFLGVGLFLPTARPRDVRLEAYVLCFATAQWAASLAAFSPAPRYVMAVVIALSLWAACGLALVTRRAAGMAGGRWLRLLPIGAVVLTMAYGAAATLAAEHLGRRPRQPREYKEAGQWMKEHLDPALVFTRKPQVGYYAGMPSTGPDRDDTVDEAVARARAAGARYFVVDERYGVQIVPALAPLLDPTQAPPGLRLRHQVTPDYPEARVLIYEIVDAAPPAP